MRKWISTICAIAAIAIVAVALTAPTATAILVSHVFVTNDASRPVPTKSVGTTAVSGSVSVNNMPADKAEPLWQGTPYAQYQLDVNIQGERCLPFTIPAGQVLFLEHLDTMIDMPATQSGNANARFTVLGSAGEVRYPIPMTEGGRSSQVAGMQQLTGGAVDIGQPVTSLRVCFVSSGGLVGQATALGYLVPAN